MLFLNVPELLTMLLSASAIVECIVIAKKMLIADVCTSLDSDGS